MLKAPAIIFFALVATACQSAPPLKQVSRPVFFGEIESISESILIQPRPFPSSLKRASFTISGVGSSVSTGKALSYTLFSTVEGVQFGKNIVISETIERVEGDKFDKSKSYEPGTKTRIVISSDGRPIDYSVSKSNGESVQINDAEAALNDAFNSRLFQYKLEPNFRGVIFDGELPGQPGISFELVAVMRGASVFKGRPVIVFDYDGAMGVDSSRAMLGGYLVVDQETGMTAYSVLKTLSPISDGRNQAHLAMEMALELPPSVAAKSPNSSIESPSGARVSVRPIAIRWEGISELLAGTVSLRQQSNRGDIFLTLPNNAGSCQGSYTSSRDYNGTWAISCTNGLTASGYFSSFGPGMGSSGEGTDSMERRVQFTVGG